MRWYEQGLIYRGQRLVNWDPVLKTAISDLEVENVEEDGFLWSIRYPLADDVSYEHVEHDADGNETLRETRDYLVVATTRPETMLGDTAVMLHPEDARYLTLHNARIVLPLTGRHVPVITDDYVDRAFGTGVVKVTPAHDFNDYQVGVRHDLPLINLFTVTATINENAPERYRGLDRYDARKLVLSELEDLGVLVETKPHKLQVPRGDRTGQVIEPHLTDQWFVKWMHWQSAGWSWSKAARSNSCRRTGSTPIVTGWRISRIGASAVSCGGAIAFRRGSTMQASATWAMTKPRCAPNMAWVRRLRCIRTATCSKPGSLRSCGRSPRWAGRMRRRWPSAASGAICRRRCWSPASTSSSSGWRA